MPDNGAAARYPLAERSPDLLRTASGLGFAEIDLQAAMDGKLSMDDLRITPDVLEIQAQVAEACGRTHLAENLRRAAELVPVPDAKILEIYNALRPGRATKQDLHDIAGKLEKQYGAERCAAFIREAAEDADRFFRG
jgi:propanediol dehydratase small subunit